MRKKAVKKSETNAQVVAGDIALADSGNSADSASPTNSANLSESNVSGAGQIEKTSDHDVLALHSRDASVFEIVPEEVFYPKNIAEIQHVVKEVAAENAVALANKENGDSAKTLAKTISVRAGGTCMSGGSLTTGKILNLTKYMNSMGEIEVLSKDHGGVYEASMIVDMGVMFKEIEKKCDSMGLMFAPYTSSKDICGIGGMIGNNASGEKSIRLGATIDNVIGLEVVLADGTMIRTGRMENTGEPLPSLIKQTELKRELQKIRHDADGELLKSIGNVPKCASGYRLERIAADAGIGGALTNIDLTPIFIGAQGTLGIVTRAKLRLVQKPLYTRLVVTSVDSIQELPFILQTVMKMNPECVETFDINTFNRAKKDHSVDTTLCQAFFHDNTTLIVLSQFAEESQEKTDEAALICQKTLATHKTIRAAYISDIEIQESVWRLRRSSFGVMRDLNPPGVHAVPCIEDIIVPVDKFDELIPALTAILAKYNLEYGFHGHIGDGSLRIIPLFDFNEKSTEGDGLGEPIVAQKIIGFTRDVIALVKSFGGNMSADHSDGIIRTPFLREFYGEKVYEAFVKTKLLFDPTGLLNKGKKVGGTEEMIKKYLIKG